ncbi:MAG: Helix-turn-helix domain protein [Methanomassiliicoccales archaeon PtaU1.Bin124]|nr:MAG: Helix-turn-helix domain protein [Methanomassiliicoccales archaeon PtaU1.Bin124]
MDELDILLSVIENPTRRRILEALVREPHYPMQLSRELGLSQQGIVKHLKVLEEYKLVRSYPVQSDQGGPARRIYVPTTGFTITVDIGPGLFNTEIETRELDEDEEEEQGLVHDNGWLKESVVDTREQVAHIDMELVDLTKRRTELIRAKEKALNEGYSRLESEVKDYQVRRVLFEYMQRPDLEAGQIAQLLDLRDEEVVGILSKYLGDE